MAAVGTSARLVAWSVLDAIADGRWRRRALIADGTDLSVWNRTALAGMDSITNVSIFSESRF
jgi:hypothetical protein